jgi:predicted AAA+ superfamily ATPase
MKRLIEEELLKWKEKKDRKPLIVYGARQVGKSHTLLEFGKNSYSNVAYFFFENNAKLQEVFNKGVDSIKTLFLELGEIIGQTIVPRNTLVIFDEIQACPAAITALKRIQETANEYHVVCAGSLLGLAIHRDANYSFPVGKVDILNMYPMNFKEFLMALGREQLIEMVEKSFKIDTALSSTMHQLALDCYRIYLVVGGMPESVQEYLKTEWKSTKPAVDFTFVKSKQLAICELYTNDMVKYCTRAESMRNIAAFNSVPSQLARENRKFQYNLIQSGARSKDFADSLFWLEKANITIKVPKTNEGKMPLAAYEDLLSFKIYFGDVGLLTAKSNLSASSILTGNVGGEMKGALTENYVAQELVASGIKPFYWESNLTAELDFVIQLDDKIVPIEAKSNVNTKAKSLDVFRKKYNIDKSIRVSAKNFGFENGIKSVPLYAVWCIK